MSEGKLRVSVWAAHVWAFATLLAFMFHGTLAYAQASSGTGVLTGTVVDASDKKPAADVVVTATSPALQGEQVVVTDTLWVLPHPWTSSGRLLCSVTRRTGIGPTRTTRSRPALRHDAPGERGPPRRAP